MLASVSETRRKPSNRDELNTMELLSGRKVDLDLIEELIAGTSSAGAGDASSGKLQGLQQFSVESTTKVVHVRATTTRKVTESSSSVLETGVGWGLGSAPPSATYVESQGCEIAAELVRKRQLRNVRKAFGLQPTPLHDSSAQLIEVGAGAWQ